MKKIIALFFYCQSFHATAQTDPLPTVTGGTLVRHASFPSAFVTARHVDVWLPDGYSDKKRYDVLYMHDGQMLFDSAITWNRQSWDVDDIASQLIRQGRIRDLIIVGIWNGGTTRHADYFPQKVFDLLTNTEREAIFSAARNNGASVFQEIPVRSDKYLRFLVQELKPFIDRTYATRTGPNHTHIAGSSMGGLISLYAICEYPSVFGSAACLSTHWPGIFTLENNPIPSAIYTYLQKKLPDPRTHKLYFDLGTATLDALYPPLQEQVDRILKKKGYSNRHWITRTFPGSEHSERAWHDRFSIPLTFLIGR